MTAAVQTRCKVDHRPDWVVAGRLIAGQDPQCEPSRADVLLAVWIMLDRGETWTVIMKRIGVSESIPRRVTLLRLRAGLRKPTEINGRLLQPLTRDERARVVPNRRDRIFLYGMGV